MNRRLLAALGVTAAISLSLTACGTTQVADAPESDAQSGGPISVTDARGEVIELDAPPSRVVTTERNVTEFVVALGIMPVGVADVEGYGTWVAAEPLDDDVTDIGTLGEPSIDTVASLQPELIVATDDLPEAAVAQLEELAPVLVTESADAEGQVERMLANTELIGEATGTSDRAEELIAGYEAKVEEGSAAIAEAGLEGTPVAFSDAYAAANQISIRPYVSGSLIASVNEQLGLTTPWTLEGDPAYGLASTDVEGLTALGDVEFVYITSDTLGADPYTEGLAGNAVWESLPFVQNGNIERLPDGIWMFGGPSSMEAYIDAIVATLTS